MSEVTHPDFGAGKVVRQVRGGRYSVVLFEGRRVPWQVETRQLKFLRKGRKAKLPKAPPEPDLKEVGPSLQILEALRLGVVPPGGTELYTVGRDLEMKMVHEDLERVVTDGGAARVVLGDYGTGKTHLLEVIEQSALERGLVVGRVVLDEAEAAPSHPKRVYRQLVNSLRFPDREERGLQPLFEGAQGNLPETFFQKDHPDFHAYLSPALAYYSRLKQAPELRDLLLDWVGGHPSLSNRELERELRRETRLRGQRLYALMDYRPWAHLYAYLAGGIAYLVRQAGYKGLCLLFDEAEFYALLNRASRDFADLLFGYYSAASVGQDGVLFELDEAPRGGHSVHRAFPPLYKEKQHLYTVFAMTDDPRGTAALERILPPSSFACLSPLRLEDYQELCRRVLDIYELVYPELEVGKTVEKPMGEVVFQGVTRQALENPRQVLKFVMELLDFSRLRRERIGDYVKEVLSYLR